MLLWRGSDRGLLSWVDFCHIAFLYGTFCLDVLGLYDYFILRERTFRQGLFVREVLV